MTTVGYSYISIYNGYNVVATSNYVYTSAGLSGEEDGWYTQRPDCIIITVGVPTLTATTLSLRIEGRYPTHNRAFEIYQSDYTTVTSIDETITIDKICPEIRVGVKVNNSASPNNIYCGLCRTEFT